MKKILTLLGLTSVLIVSAAQAQLQQYDGFAYTVGSTLAGNGTWTNLNSGVAPVIASGNLTVSGLQSPTGERVSWGSGNIQEAWDRLGSTNSSGTLYYSFAFQLTSIPTTATYSFGFTGSSTTYGSTVWLTNSGTSFSIGLAARTATNALVYDTATFTTNDLIFLVGSYEFVSGATNNDISRLWINPSSADFGANSAPLPTLDITNVAAGTDLTNGINGFLLRGANGSPAGTMDELRIGTDWASVTPVPEPSSYAMLALAGAGFAGYVIRRRRR
jgi:hypothetical protein